MSITVDHQARKAEILQKALGLFARQGYPGVTFQQLADCCGLARTALYKYFQNKRDIFDGAIALMVRELGRDFRQDSAKNHRLGAGEKLILVMDKVLQYIFANPQLLQAITEYLIDQRRMGEDISAKVRRHTVVMRRTLIQLLREGVANGEFRPLDCRLTADVLYALLEAAALRVAVTDTADQSDLNMACKAAIASLSLKP
ncbi:MAG: TetR/AcrR family transcriptional regulator [Oligosphaeraceae bacterium]|nr:TetR/AcrR family transcriptional regulator [Oligosphaeraceae bacterium]